jgi:hypothetical protein
VSYDEDRTLHDGRGRNPATADRPGGILDPGRDQRRRLDGAGKLGQKTIAWLADATRAVE